MADEQEDSVLQKRLDDLRHSRDAVSGALAHGMHRLEPEMFFLAVRDLLNSVRFLVDGYDDGAEESNRR